MNDDSSRLEVWNEWVEAPAPTKTTEFLKADPARANPEAVLDPTLSDDRLSFGGMAIGRGTAFPLNADPAGPAPGADAAAEAVVGKEWITLPDGEGKDQTLRTFLIEKVEYRDVETSLLRLPKLGAAPPANDPAARLARPRREMLASLTRPLIREVKARPAGTRKMEMAAVLPTSAGYVLDYELVLSGTFVSRRFLANESYLVLGSCTLSSTVGAPTVIEGGAVFKFTNAANNRLLFSVWAELHQGHNVTSNN